jgi:hypothetical protein
MLGRDVPLAGAIALLPRPCIADPGDRFMMAISVECGQEAARAKMAETPGDEFGAFAADADSRRRHRRWFVDFRSTFQAGEETLPCAVCDLSPGGACIEPSEPSEIVVGALIVFDLPGFGSIPAEVRYAGGGYLGLMFQHDQEGEVELARYLVAIEQNRRRERQGAEPVVVLRASGVDTPCAIVDISRHGARLRPDETRHISAGQEVVLALAGLAGIAAIVQGVEDREIAVAFLQDLAEVPAAFAGSAAATG